MIEETKDKILIPGDCQIEDIFLFSYNDFKIEIPHDHISEVVIEESLNDYCLTGYLHIIENINYIRNVPLIGNERITITFITPSRKNKVKKTFFCYKVDSKIESENNKGLSSYRLHFVSEEFITNQKKKISLSFKDMKYSEMVFKIFDTYLNSSKRIITQPTLQNKNFIVPYMNPFQAIDLLCLKCISDDNKDKSYVFYEDLDGFYFTNINYYAMDKVPLVEYTWSKTNISEEPDAINLKNIEKEFYRIESYDIISTNNTINNIKNGMFSSMLLTHDSTFKTVDAYTFSYNPDFYGLNTITQNNSLPKNKDVFSSFNMAHYRMYPHQSYAYSGVELNDIYDKTMLERNTHMAQMENSRLTILVPGDSDRRVGEAVKVNLPSLQPSYKSEEEYDPYLSGNYIITRITHMITPRFHYKMRLYLERDSMPIPYPEEKKVEVKI